ncbi:MAG: hypothetical protein ACYDB3_07225 [Acidimicrobiales bacterium]
MKRRLFTALAATTALVVGFGGGAALAYFTGSGAGSGSASTGALAPVTVAAATGTPGTSLLPGGSGDVILDVTNPNPYPVTLIDVMGNGNITADAPNSSCTTTGVTFHDQTGLSVDIPGNGAVTPVDLSGAASMGTTSLSACQGAEFSVPVSITVHKG